MNEIKWIKIYTDMVNNKKIKSIRKMPEGNNIVLIWVLLIAQAGECNKTGALYLTDTIPFTVDELAIQLDFDKQILNLALRVLEKYEMIEVFDDIIFIKNWEKYQNETGMERIREQTRVRVARYRENNNPPQISSQCNATVTLPVTDSNGDVTQQNKIKNKNKNKDIYISSQHLSMSEDEYNKLVEIFGDVAVLAKIDYSRNYAKLKNYKSLYLTLKNWLEKDNEKIVVVDTPKTVNGVRKL
jgi:predicted phage replisome organizer